MFRWLPYDNLKLITFVNFTLALEFSVPLLVVWLWHAWLKLQASEQRPFLHIFLIFLILSYRTGLNSAPFYAYTYWFGNVLSSIGGIFALVLSLVVIVHGQALALRGPPGSMVRA